jgi:hypothetical protein
MESHHDRDCKNGPYCRIELMSSGLLTADDWSVKVLVAFGLPPVAISAAGLLRRVAVHNSIWEAVPVFVMVFALGVASSLILAFAFSGRGARPYAVPRFLIWMFASALCIVAGLAIIELVPMSVGDGP